MPASAFRLNSLTIYKILISKILKQYIHTEKSKITKLLKLEKLVFILIGRQK